MRGGSRDLDPVLGEEEIGTLQEATDRLLSVKEGGASSRTAEVAGPQRASPRGPDTTRPSRTAMNGLKVTDAENAVPGHRPKAANAVSARYASPQDMPRSVHDQTSDTHRAGGSTYRDSATDGTMLELALPRAVGPSSRQSPVDLYVLTPAMALKFEKSFFEVKRAPISGKKPLTPRKKAF